MFTLKYFSDMKVVFWDVTDSIQYYNSKVVYYEIS